MDDLRVSHRVLADTDSSEVYGKDCIRNSPMVGRIKVTPFGLTNACSVFQRLMQKVLMGLNPESRPDIVSAYIDDILVFLEEHIHHLQLVQERVITAYMYLKLKPSKVPLSGKK